MNVQKFIKEVTWLKIYGADLVVSFHINSSNSPIARGSEVYVTQNTRVDRFYKNSNQLAVNVLNNLYNIGIPRNGKFSAKLRPTESGNRYPDGSYADYYGIIRYPMNYGIPSVLIEHCFISNAEDRKFINNDWQIDRIAQADAQAIIANKELFRFDKTRNAVKGAFNSMYYDGNTGSIKGNVLYNEVINDMSVDTMPVVSLVSKDGTEKRTGTVTKTASFTYFYDINIMNLNPYKEYYLQVETNDKNSIPQNNALQLSIPNGQLGYIYGMEIICKNNTVTFNAPTYDGMLVSFPFMEDLKIDNNMILGRIVAQEWVNNGTTQAEPKVTPNVFLVAEDGTKIQCTVKYLEQYLYEISCNIVNIDINKKYNIKVEVATDKNVTIQREQELKYTDKTLGFLGNNTAFMKNNKIEFRYDGYMVSYPFNQEISLRENKITGQLVVQEWLNGTKQIEPTTLPKLVVKDTEGREVAESTLTKVMPCLYSYELDLGTVSKGNYTLEVQGTNPNNTSTHQKIEIQYNDREIGLIGTDIIKIVKGKLVREEKNNKYDGYIVSYPFNQEISLRENKIAGQLVVQEWLNGTKQMEPITLPKLVLKDETGEEIAKSTLTKVMPCLYSYELDLGTVSKGNYTLEVQGTNPNNTSTHQKIEIQYNDREVGLIGTNIIKIEKGKIIIEQMIKTQSEDVERLQVEDIFMERNQKEALEDTKEENTEEITENTKKVEEQQEELE